MVSYSASIINILKMDHEIIILRLKKMYPPGRFATRDPFRALIATVLSQRTRDEVTDMVSERLFARYGDPSSLSKADVNDIEVLIREVGFYRVKAPRLKEIARIIDNEYGGKVPDNMEELLSLPGVGRKTANCVLVYGFGKDAVAVDTHVHRISNRLGLVSTGTPDETEYELCRMLPKKHWKHVNEIMIRFGKDICRPAAPKCVICPFRECPTR